MATRDSKKCEEVRQELVLESANKFVYCRQCDLASFKSIRKFADRFNAGNLLRDLLLYKVNLTLVR